MVCVSQTKKHEIKTSPAPMPRLVFVEGLIGSGKTTALKHLEDYIKEMGLQDRAAVVYEPVELWQKLNLLELFYADRHRWAYTFQNMAFITKMQVLDTLSDDGMVYFIERSPYVDKRVFAAICHENADMTPSEWELYNMWYNYFIAQFESKHDIEFLYLRTSVNTCAERITTRNRKGEAGIPAEYLKLLEVKHDEWLSEPGLLVHAVNGEEDPSTILEAVKNVLKM
jgi:deoxyadenosine/deoxycytidine kinase